ncbi:MAG TPA: hypothetical protein VJ377_06910 [Dehalococcoidales bacterium]|nr:MAG: hypothetical protein A2Z05_01450 [Chloroflexi bacterium RBG_16_60_22]HJX13241.1 hypothetical protein [Dehalococcoidales bacterium]
MAGKYDKYVVHPPHVEISSGDDGRVVFNGRMVSHAQLGYNMTMGLQFINRPFKSDNPCHTHNFQEFLAWYGGNPDDPEDFGAEVVLYLGEEMEKHVFTRPTIVNLPAGFPHCPLEVTRVDRPIIQVEIMLVGEGGTRDVYFEKDKKGHRPVTFKVLG